MLPPTKIRRKAGNKAASGVQASDLDKSCMILIVSDNVEQKEIK